MSINNIIRNVSLFIGILLLFGRIPAMASNKQQDSLEYYELSDCTLLDSMMALSNHTAKPILNHNDGPFLFFSDYNASLFPYDHYYYYFSNIISPERSDNLRAHNQYQGIYGWFCYLNRVFFLAGKVPSWLTPTGKYQAATSFFENHQFDTEASSLSFYQDNGQLLFASVYQDSYGVLSHSLFEDYYIRNDIKCQPEKESYSLLLPVFRFQEASTIEKILSLYELTAYPFNRSSKIMLMRYLTEEETNNQYVELVEWKQSPLSSWDYLYLQTWIAPIGVIRHNDYLFILHGISPPDFLLETNTNTTLYFNPLSFEDTQSEPNGSCSVCLFLLNKGQISICELYDES